MKLRMASLTILCLALVRFQPGRIMTTVPSTAPPMLGPSTLAMSVSNSVCCRTDQDGSGGRIVTGFKFGVWEFPGDAMTSVDWSLTTGENGGTVLGSGTATGNNMTDKFISTNQYGYNIDMITVTGPECERGQWRNRTGSTCRTRSSPAATRSIGMRTAASAATGRSDCPSRPLRVPSARFLRKRSPSIAAAAPPGALLNPAASCCLAPEYWV